MPLKEYMIADKSPKEMMEPDTTSNINNEIATPLDEYDDYMDELELPKVLMGGTSAIRAKCEWSTENTYLPADEHESKAAWTARKNKSFLFKAFARTVDKLAGEIFANPIILNNEAPEQVTGWAENIDLEQHDLNTFAQPILEQGIAYGTVHILADYARTKIKVTDGITYYLSENEWKPFTQAVEKEKGWRPYLVHIKPDQIIGWRFGTIQGEKKLLQVRIKETTKEASGAYGVKNVERIRLLEPGKFELWKKEEVSGTIKWVLEDQGTTALDYIPLTTMIFGDKKTDMVSQVPLEGLAFLNLEHFQSSSDQRNILYYARFPLFFGKCLVKDTDDRVIVGPNRLIYSDDPQGDLKTVEHTGTAIGAGRQDLIDLENKMALFGLTLLMPRTGNPTATEKAINSSENDTGLPKFAKILEKGLNNAFKHMADIVKLELGNVVSVNNEFRHALAGYEPKILLDAAVENILPYEVIWEEFQRRGLIKDTYDIVDLREMLDKQYENKMSFMPAPLTDEENNIEEE